MILNPYANPMAKLFDNKIALYNQLDKFTRVTMLTPGMFIVESMRCLATYFYGAIPYNTSGERVESGNKVKIVHNTRGCANSSTPRGEQYK